MNSPASGLLIFDGDCGFCSSSADWVARSWPAGPRAVAWQHLGPETLEELGLSREQAQEAAWWVDATGKRFKGHRAITKSLLAARGWKQVVGALITIPPLSWGAAALYPVIVRYRYHLPGGTPDCRIGG